MTAVPWPRDLRTIRRGLPTLEALVPAMHAVVVSSIDLESTDLEARAKVLSALGDPIRLRILDEVGGCERCVCDLQEALDIAPNLLSYHLRILREAGLVVGARRGRWVDYILAPDAAALIGAVLPASVREAVAPR